jgi:DNA-binding PadR family transcriptional regulator
MVKLEGLEDFDRDRECELTAKQTMYLRYYTERLIKSNLDMIVLCLLKDNPMCGHDVIKSVFAKYDTFLSQGTVYPILYSLKNEGVIEVISNPKNMRSKIYSITSEGEKVFEDRLTEFIRAEEHVLNSINHSELKEPSLPEH